MSEQNPITITAKDLEAMYNLNQRLESQVANINGDNQKLESQVRRLNDRIKGLESQIAIVNSRIPNTNLLSPRLLVRAFTVVSYTWIVSAIVWFSASLFMGGLAISQYFWQVMIVVAILVVIAFVANRVSNSRTYDHYSHKEREEIDMLRR